MEYKESDSALNKMQKFVRNNKGEKVSKLKEIIKKYDKEKKPVLKEDKVPQFTRTKKRDQNQLSLKIDTIGDLVRETERAEQERNDRNRKKK